VADFVVRIGGRWYGGARYRLMQMSVSADLSESPITLPPADLQLRTGLLGPHVQWDSRNSEFYPTTGLLFDGMALFAGTGVGGRRSYQTYQLAVSRYAGIGQRHVIAAKINSCLAEGDAPFYDLCLLGQFQDIRGYPTGQYRDRSMLTAQAEYRLKAWWRVGLVAFGGAGQVAPAFSGFAADAILPSAGAGVRFRLTRETPLNLRVDYAWGRGSQAMYISVGEAF
jgi:outer membrane protein assembly factor BamA